VYKGVSQAAGQLGMDVETLERVEERMNLQQEARTPVLSAGGTALRPLALGTREAHDDQITH
jgi:hypothetical protein